MGVLLKDLFVKVQTSSVKPWIKYPALVLIGCGVGIATIYGV